MAKICQNLPKSVKTFPISARNGQGLDRQFSDSDRLWIGSGGTSATKLSGTHPGVGESLLGLLTKQRVDGHPCGQPRSPEAAAVVKKRANGFSTPPPPPSPVILAPRV